MGFEPTRAEPIGLAVQRLNHSATSSCLASVQHNSKMYSHAGSRTRAPWVKARYPSR